MLCWSPQMASAQAGGGGFSRALKPMDDAADFLAGFVAHRFWHAVFLTALAMCLLAWGVLKRTEALWGVIITGIAYMLYVMRDDIFSGWA
jgi:hypothetical protein